MTKKNDINEIDFGDFSNPKRSIRVHHIKQLNTQIKERTESYNEQLEKIKSGEAVYSDSELALFHARHEFNIKLMEKDLRESIAALPPQQQSEFVKQIENERKIEKEKQNKLKI